MLSQTNGALYLRTEGVIAPYYKTGGSSTTGWKQLAFLEDIPQIEESLDSSSPVGDTYSQSEVQSILDELRDLKTKMRSSGLLES